VDRRLVELRLPSAGHAPIAGDATAAAANLVGLDTQRADRLGSLTAQACELIEQTAYDYISNARLEVTVRQRGDHLLVEIDDRGIPFNQEEIDAVLDRVVGPALREGVIEGYDHLSRGRSGNRSVLVAHLDPGQDVREIDGAPTQSIRVDGAPTQPIRVNEATAQTVSLREAGGDDAEALARLTWRTYGYSYQRDAYYYPAQLRNQLESDERRGWVLVEPDDEVVAHLAVALSQADSLVAEGGRGMVDPRYRGFGLMRRMGISMLDWATERGVIGLYGHAVTAHTRTQGGGDGSISGILLGYLPPLVEFKGMSTEVTGRRQAVAMTYSALAEQPERTVHVPAADLEIVEETYERLGLSRIVKSVPRSEPKPLPPAADPKVEHRVDVLLRKDLGTARFVVNVPGERALGVLRSQLRTVADAGIEVTYVWLPLSDPQTPLMAQRIERLGFYSGGVIPYAAADGGDILHYERTGDLPIEPDDINLASPFSERLLDHVLHRRAAAQGR
jgi:GNAT superfamily N-acetyltransferase